MGLFFPRPSTRRRDGCCCEEKKAGNYVERGDIMACKVCVGRT